MKNFITKKRDRLYCEKCDNLVHYKTIKQNETFKVKGEEIKVLSEKAICSPENISQSVFDIEFIIGWEGTPFIFLYLLC